MGRHQGTSSRVQRGFTVIELMVVVVIIAILAAVVIPNWLHETRKAKHQTEVTAMFAELTVKLEQYKIEIGSYPTVVACPATGPVPAGYDFFATCVVPASVWESLRIQPPNAKLYCSYAITGGLASATPAPPAGFTMTAPSTAWWFIVAECDMDSHGGTNATYFQSSMDTKIQKLNEGL